MTIGPIDWGAHDPDLVERVLAVMLLQERPRAWRRERSRGDAGVDVADAHVDGYEVLQIKSFTGSLTSRRKRDIEKAYQSALAGGELDRPITSWRLLLPMDPSKEAEKWFKKLTASAPFECEWLGKARVDLLAATHPHVVDYYLRDGRSRVEQRYRDLLQMRDLFDAAETGPRPSDVTDGLRRLLEGLNRDDPHYHYAFEASHDQPPTEVERARPGLVMAMTECAPEGGCVTIRVFARHRHAVEERPITIAFGIEPESDAHLELQNTFSFGSTANLPHGSVSNLRVDAPGGLNAQAESAGMRVSGHAEAGFVTFRLVFSVLGEDGQALARTPVAVTERRAGLRGKELTCIEAGSAFSLQMRVTDPYASDIEVAMSSWSLDFWGKPAAQAHDGVALLSHLHAPNTLVVSLEDGERHLMTLHLRDEEPPFPRDIASFVGDLAAVQRHAPVILLIPTTITAGDARCVREAARLLSGTLIDGQWANGHLVVNAQQVGAFLQALGRGEPCAAPVPYHLRVGSQQVDLGHYLLRLASAVAVDPDAARAEAKKAESPTDGVRIDVVPGDDRRFEMLWISERADQN